MSAKNGATIRRLVESRLNGVNSDNGASKVTLPLLLTITELVRVPNRSTSKPSGTGAVEPSSLRGSVAPLKPGTTAAAISSEAQATSNSKPKPNEMRLMFHPPLDVRLAGQALAAVDAASGAGRGAQGVKAGARIRGGEQERERAGGEARARRQDAEPARSGAPSNSPLFRCSDLRTG